MKFFSSQQIKKIDQLSIKSLDITSFDLMERAAVAFVTIFQRNFSKEFACKIFCGPGNNGGDGLAISRLLYFAGYQVEVFDVSHEIEKSADNSKNESLLTNYFTVKYIKSEVDFPLISENDIIVDALFGAGLNRPLNGIFTEIISYLNNTNAYKRISIDIPSGLFGEGISQHQTIFKADYTYTFQYPFLSFFFEENEVYVGGWKVLDIGIPKQVETELVSQYYFTTKKEIYLKKRPQFGHKGTFGHALIIAGSKEMTGAAVLSGKSCLKTGCGLVTVHVPGYVASIIQSSFPEAICSIDSHNDILTVLPNMQNYNAIAIGPGVGKKTETAEMLKKLLQNLDKPLIIDADALNIISENPELLELLPENTILTPHPGEFKRLFGDAADSFERLKLLQEKAILLKILIVLKGKYTCIALPNGELHFNSTGNNGMATAGSGDVLTGIIVSLLAQQYTPEQAAITGVYLHGLAGDLALKELEPESLIASDILNNISNAFREIKMNQ